VITAIDVAVLAILAVAVARGTLIGLIREGFSLAALAAAVFATRLATPAAASWLEAWSQGRIGAELALWLAGAVIAIASVCVVAGVGALLRRGARLAGLGWADRLGGAALGAAEGALVAVLLMTGSLWLLGRSHPTLASSRSLAAYEQLQGVVARNADRLPPVAAPGSWAP
jgi:uncharacterized membrane protein required for colicin V production